MFYLSSLFLLRQKGRRLKSWQVFGDTHFVLGTLCQSPGHGEAGPAGNEGLGSREEEVLGVPWAEQGSSSSATGAEKRKLLWEPEVSSEKHLQL